MSDAISIVQLNIERSKHLERAIPFLTSAKPEVVCLQELCEEDIEKFESALGMKCFYAPMAYFTDTPGKILTGVGIFTNYPIVSNGIEYYSGEGENIPVYVHPDQNTIYRVFIWVEIEKNSTRFRIGNTHFTWTSDGESSPEQHRDLESLFYILERTGDIVFMGDFNAPRDGEIFARLANRYKDNVPINYCTSLDRNLHRAGNLDRMVDGIFSSPTYTVENVNMICGVSDHCAITAIIKRS